MCLQWRRDTLARVQSALSEHPRRYPMHLRQSGHTRLLPIEHHLLVAQHAPQRGKAEHRSSPLVVMPIARAFHTARATCSMDVMEKAASIRL